MNTTYTTEIQHVDQETKRDLNRIAHWLTVIQYMDALDKAWNYDDFDCQEWQTRAHELGITADDMKAYRESEARIALGRPLPF